MISLDWMFLLEVLVVAFIAGFGWWMLVVGQGR